MPVEKDIAARGAPGPEALLTGVDPRRVDFADADARRRLEPALSPRSRSNGIRRWSLVKHNVARTVYRCQSGEPAGVLYLKHFHSRDPWHRLQRRLGVSDARCEMRFSRYLIDRGVPVPAVLATWCRNGVEWLISQGVEPATPADRWHAEQLAEEHHAAIRTATVALAELVGRMHALGVLHRDLHCGNVLVRDDRPGDLVLTDLHRMCRRRRLTRRVRAANLAQLLSDRRLWTTRSQRLRFLKHYLRASRAEGTLRGWVRLIEPLADRHDRRLNAQRDRRIFGSNPYFDRLQVAGYRMHVVLASKRRVPGSQASRTAFTARDWTAALGDLKGLLTGPDMQVVKDSPSSYIVRRRLRVGRTDLDVFIKRQRRKRLIRWAVDPFRQSRALRAFRLGHALLGRHIHTALPLVALERRRGPFLLDSILITEAVDSGMHLNRFLNRYLSPAGEGDTLGQPGRSRLARQVLWQLGRLLRRLHGEGFAHRDLKASNLLVHWDGLPAHPPDLVLVDLDGLKPVHRVTRRQEFRGLMRLNVSLLECPVVSHAGRLRMLMGYLRRPGSGPVHFKPYWRLLQEWSSRTIRRQIAARQRRQKVQRRNQP